MCVCACLIVYTFISRTSRQAKVEVDSVAQLLFSVHLIVFVHMSHSVSLALPLHDPLYYTHYSFFSLYLPAASPYFIYYISLHRRSRLSHSQMLVIQSSLCILAWQGKKTTTT